MNAKLLLLYLDADVYKKLARELRRRGYDAVSAIEVGMREASDREHLEFAISEGRVVLTFNIGDFVQLHKEYVEAQREHYGIIVSPQYGIGETLRRVVNLSGSLPADKMRRPEPVEGMNRLEYLSSWG